MKPVHAFAFEVGKGPSIVPFNIPFEQCAHAGSNCFWYRFPTPEMQSIRRYGAIPMLNWGSMASPYAGSGVQPAYTLARVLDGRFDRYIRAFAEAAKTWGRPFFLRFDWEMNGNWFPWAQGANGNQPGQSAAVWRHVHDIFTSVGADNVGWVWCPSVITQNAEIELSSLYPGDRYVDWTCLDGYNWGTRLHGRQGWQTFGRIYTRSYDEITTRIAPRKPMMIGEVASSAAGGDKSRWITSMFSEIRSRLPDIRALVWYDHPSGEADWGLEGHDNGLGAFRLGVHLHAYESNTFGGLARAPNALIGQRSARG